MIAWRLVAARFEATAFTGEGARLFGGRWTGRGRPVVYVAQTASLSVLEVAVHLEALPIPNDYRMFEVRFDDSDVRVEDVRENGPLPPGWSGTRTAADVRKRGNDWLKRGSSAVLRVPSVVVPVEDNFLLNPAHPDFAAIEIAAPRPFRLDPRLTRG